VEFLPDHGDNRREQDEATTLVNAASLINRIARQS
jgi:hypothetical protein